MNLDAITQSKRLTGNVYYGNSGMRWLSGHGVSISLLEL